MTPWRQSHNHKGAPLEGVDEAVAAKHKDGDEAKPAKRAGEHSSRRGQQQQQPQLAQHAADLTQMVPQKKHAGSIGNMAKAPGSALTKKDAHGSFT